MYIDPQWSPVIGEAIRWVGDAFSSKRQMRMNIDELSRKVDQLSYGNTALAQRQDEILSAVIAELRAGDVFIVNHGAISIATTIQDIDIEAPTDGLQTLDPPDSNLQNRQGSEVPGNSLFDGVSEEIAEARLTRPSERESN